MTRNLPGEISDDTSNAAKDAAIRPSVGQSVNHRNGWLPILYIATIFAVLGSGYWAFLSWTQHNDDSNIVRASGRIEANETHIAAPTATRVKSVNVKEGDTVHKGQLLVILNSDNLQKKIRESALTLNTALNARHATDVQVAVVEQQVSDARAKSRGFFAKILSTKGGRQKEETRLRAEMMQAKMMSMQARSAVASVQGGREQAMSKLSYFNIISPINGICTIRSTQPGELVAPGQVLLTLVNDNSAYVRGFVPESDVVRIKIGQPARVFLDSSGTDFFSGKVTAIDAAPSFTPANIYFEKDRVRQAFGIKISIDHPNGLAKPGMPAEAKILLSSDKKL